MIVNTRDFGEMDISDADIITFKEPILGFERLRKFCKISENEIGGNFIWLQSLEEHSTCFICLSPFIIDGGYNPKVLDNTTMKKLEIDEGDNIEYLCIAVIRDSIEDSTINLKSPIVINTSENLAMQVISDEEYDIRHLIFKAGGG